MEKEETDTGNTAAGLLIGMAAGIAVTYAMSGDAMLLRRNLRKAERGAERLIHKMEKDRR